MGNSKFKSQYYDDEEILYYTLRMVDRPHANPPSQNKLELASDSYKAVFAELKSRGYIEDYTPITLNNGGTVNYNASEITFKGYGFLEDMKEEYEDLYLSFLEHSKNL